MQPMGRREFLYISSRSEEARGGFKVSVGNVVLGAWDMLHFPVSVFFYIALFP